MTITETTSLLDLDTVVDRYLAVWQAADSDARRAAVAELWAPDAVEFVEGAQFRGHAELTARVAEAYREFVESGRYTVATAGDTTRHDNVVVFTIQLITDTGVAAWEARVFLVVGEDGLVWQDYQLTVTPLAA